MRIALVSFVVCAILNGCGLHFLSDRIVPATDKAFLEYIDSFENTLNIKVNPRIPIYFSDLKDPRVGECWRWKSGYREIKVDSKYWKEIDSANREQLIWHELGHCILHLKHDDEYVLLGARFCPISVMKSNVFSLHETNSCFKLYRQYYADILVQQYHINRLLKEIKQ